MLKVGNCKHGTPCIYEIRNTVTGRVYVGSTPRFSQRFTEHKRMLDANKHHSRKLQASYRKHGASSFVMKVIEVVSHPAFIYAREQFWIDKHGFSNTYNSAPVAMGATRLAEPVYSIDPKTGIKTHFASATVAASEVLGSSEKMCQVRNAIYSRRKAGGRFWTKDKNESLGAFMENKRILKNEGKQHKVFAFTRAGKCVNSFATIADAASFYQVSESAIGQAIRSEAFRTSAGLLWNNQNTPKQVVSRKTKTVVQKQNGTIIAVWNSLLEAVKSVAGTNIKGISSAATGYTKSHRGYQWEFAKS
jgi:group I intron endonuclease